MPRTKEQPIPRSIVVTADMMKPSLAEAFTRWKEMGEYPADAMLCRLFCDFSTMLSVLTDLHTGRKYAADDDTLETLTHVQVKNAVPSQRYYLILRKCD